MNEPALSVGKWEGDNIENIIKSIASLQNNGEYHLTTRENDYGKTKYFFCKEKASIIVRKVRSNTKTSLNTYYEIEEYVNKICA